MTGPRVVIVGVGRVGGALALHLEAAGWNVSVQTTRPRRARAFHVRLATDADFGRARLCILSVPDDAVASVASEVDARIGQKTSLVHCSGALTLEAFGLPHRSRGSFHPLAAISDAHDDPSGKWAALAATERGLLTVLKRVAQAMKMHALEVPEARRVAYHAGAVMSAGLVLALVDAAAEAAGIDPRALLALTASAVEGARERGLVDALTGPVVRGDANVIAAHLGVLPPELRSLYESLSRRMLKLASKRLGAGPKARVAAVLDREHSAS